MLQFTVKTPIMVSSQTKRKQSVVPESSKEVVKKKIKKKTVKVKKIHPKSKRGQIHFAQSLKQQDGPVKHSIEVRVRTTHY